MSPSLKLSPPLLSPRDVHIWRFSLEADTAAIASAATLLSPDERDRADRFVLPELWRRFVVARATLRQLLSTYLVQSPEALVFKYAPTGKPELPNREVHFNLSHSGESALIAVALGNTDIGIGVDLEFIRPIDFQAVARTVLSDKDLRALTQSPDADKPHTFFRLWVRHEARVKAHAAPIGTHLDLPVYDLDIAPTYKAAVATPFEDAHILQFDWPAAEITK